MNDTMNMQTYNAVIETVRNWPTAQRFALIQDVLATLAPNVLSDVMRQPTLQQALGLLATASPAPSDQDIAHILDERRRERYGI